MAGLTCDLCGGTLEVGQGGSATCIECGIKHSSERLQEKLADLRGAGPGAPVPEATRVPVVDSDSLAANLLDMATQANESGNLAETETYCNRVIELQPDDYRAWLLKGRAAGWQSTLARIRIHEAANSFARAITCAPSEEANAVREACAGEIGAMSVAIVQLRAQRFVRWPDEEETAGFTTDLATIAGAIAALLGKSGVGAASVWEGIASEINTAVVTAWSETIEKEFRRSSHPSDDDFRLFVSRIGHAIQLEELAIGLSDADDDADVERYQNIIVLTQARINAKSFTWTPNGHVPSLELAPSAIEANRKIIDDARRKSAEIKARMEKAREEQAAAVREAYWAQHPERFRELRQARWDLTGRVKNLRKEIDELPGFVEQRTLRATIHELVEEQHSLGRFKAKERKALQDKIDEWELRLTACRLATDKEVKRLKGEITDTERRLREAEAELSKARSPDELTTGRSTDLAEVAPGTFAEIVEATSVGRLLTLGLMGEDLPPTTRLTDPAEGLDVGAMPDDRGVVTQAASVFDNHLSTALGAGSSKWTGPMLHLSLRTPLGHVGEIALGRRTVTDPHVLRVLVKVARRVPHDINSSETWLNAALWPALKAEMYYLWYAGSGLFDDSDPRDQISRAVDSVGSAAPGPLTDPEALSDPILLTTGSNPRALPGPGGARLVCLDERESSRGDLWVGWEVDEHLAIPLLVIYLHRAVLALIDIPHEVPQWLSEVGGEAQ